MKLTILFLFLYFHSRITLLNTLKISIQKKLSNLKIKMSIKDRAGDLKPETLGQIPNFATY